MTSIRILLAEMPAVLKSIVGRALEQEPDMTVVAQDVARDQIETLAIAMDADVIVMRGGEPPSFSDLEPLFRARPRIKMVVISNTGRDATLSEMRLMNSTISDISPGTLVQAIRTATHVGSG